MVKPPKKEQKEPTEAQAAKLRDDALRRALQTPPTQHNVKPKREKKKTP
jgi:hypothetical protein